VPRGSKPRGPPLESHISYFLFPIIVFHDINKPHILLSWLHVPCTVLVPDTLCSLNIINITWRWKRLDDWLDLIGWMYWIHVYPTAGDGSAGYQLYTAHW